MTPLNKRAFFVSTAVCALLAGLTGAALAQTETPESVQNSEVSKSMPPGWNGNLCQPDSMRLCLGLEGHSRDAWVQCLREHYAQLTPDCQEVMAPANFKAPVHAEEGSTAKAAPILMDH